MFSGCTVYKGEVEEVYTDERKVKVYCQHYPGPSYPKQHVTFVVRYEKVFLIKGTGSDEEGDPNIDTCDVEELDVCDD